MLLLPSLYFLMDNDYNLPHLLEITRGEIFLKKKYNNLTIHDTPYSWVYFFNSLCNLGTLGHL